MGKMKPIDGKLVIVTTAHAKGVKGPFPKSKIPANAYGCGEIVGWQCLVFDLERQRVAIKGWMFDTREEAEAHARKWRSRARKKLKANLRGIWF